MRRIPFFPAHRSFAALSMGNGSSLFTRLMVADGALILTLGSAVECALINGTCFSGIVDRMEFVSSILKMLVIGAEGDTLSGVSVLQASFEYSQRILVTLYILRLSMAILMRDCWLAHNACFSCVCKSTNFFSVFCSRSANENAPLVWVD